MANEVTEKDLDKVRSDNEKIAEQILEAERALSEIQLQTNLVNDKQLLENENDRLKQKLASIKAQVKAQQAAASPSEQAAAAGQRYEDVVSVNGDTPQEAAPVVAPEEKKAGN